MNGHSILVADDDTSVIAALRLLLQTHQYEVVAVTTPQALLEQIATRDFTAAFIDLNYQKDTTSGKEGLSLIEQIRKHDEDMPIIAMTGYSSVEIAVEAMKLGAADFIQKPWSNERLLHTLRTQITLNQARHQGDKLAQENALLKQQMETGTSEIIAYSPAMQDVLGQLEKLAQSDMSILLTGENGTGKSVLAEYVHQHSTRASNVFIAVNMGAISETLFESEMFGHVKGAFTDASSNRIGRFELAQSGTIFLDEIANIGLPQQAKLLRVLEERQFERVGSSKTQRIDVRLISATNADLNALVDTETFRQDLLYRLNTITVHVPALRERVEDILPLASQYIATFAQKYRLPVKQISPSAQQALITYDWPGNVRELGHVIERAMFLSAKALIDVDDLAIERGTPRASESPPDWATQSLDELEKKIIQQRLEQFNHNPQKTAESLGLSRSAYYRRLEKYQLN
jgi:DNA-binding NtrC family response regulator